MPRSTLQKRYSIPPIRLISESPSPINPEGEFVLYWMSFYRRTQANFALQRALWWSLQLNLPLVMVETLFCDTIWENKRSDSFVLQGIPERRKLLRTKLTYLPIVGDQQDKLQESLLRLAKQAAIIITDYWPLLPWQKKLQVFVQKCPTKIEEIDSCGLLPLAASPKDFYNAYSFRRFLQREIPEHLMEFPLEKPLENLTPLRQTAEGLGFMQEIRREADKLNTQFPVAHPEQLSPYKGGETNAQKRLEQFLNDGLPQYESERNHPDSNASSRLSPYLRHGFISTHQIFSALIERENWNIGDLSFSPKGHRRGWWHMSSPTEAFLDQLITWRELGYNMCFTRKDYDSFDSLPPWAIETLSKHKKDPRPYLYTKEELEKAMTHDSLWNAAQRELLQRGLIHNYLRMLWGKKIIEWSRSPEEALEMMIELNNRYALDGDDPNSYTGIFWCLGRYDHGWAERPIFGKIRFMSSENTARKVKIKNYLNRFSGDENHGM